MIVSKDLNGSPQKKELKEILTDEMILDIGPKTIENIAKIIDNSKTILWNGPAGYFENPNFSYGSIQIAKKIIENNKAKKIFSVVGGGDTVSLINNLIKKLYPHHQQLKRFCLLYYFQLFVLLFEYFHKQNLDFQNILRVHSKV